MISTLKRGFSGVERTKSLRRKGQYGKRNYNLSIFSIGRSVLFDLNMSRGRNKYLFMER